MEVSIRVNKLACRMGFQERERTPVQRIMMFVSRESPAQKSLFALVPRHWKVPLELFVAEKCIVSFGGVALVCWMVLME